MVDQEKNKKIPLQKDQEAGLVKRLDKFKEKLKESSLDAFVVTSYVNKHYLTGWDADSESGWLVVSQNETYILTDFRYTEQAKRSTKNIEVLEYDIPLTKFFGEFSLSKKFKRVGFEDRSISVSEFEKLKKFSKHLDLEGTENFIEELRSVKDDLEIVNLRKAVGIADKAFEHILRFVKVGMTEAEIAWEMEKDMRESGASKMAWSPFIVATGDHSSMAHWGASDCKIKKGDMVLLDYGCVYKGYHSDTTRVFFMGKPSEEQKNIYDLVLKAQKLGESLVGDGENGQIIDRKVKKFLENKTKFFYKHSLGHGVGLEIHEAPKLSAKFKSQLQVGNVLTIEPGIYIPGWGGVRLEDIVVVKKDSCEIITKVPKEIKEVIV